MLAFVVLFPRGHNGVEGVAEPFLDYLDVKICSLYLNSNIDVIDLG